MANPSKQKGTAGETELRRLLAEEYGLTFRRTPPGSKYDLTNERPNVLELEPQEVLATRPDHGEWLVTLRLGDWAELLREHEIHHEGATGAWETHIEVKRYARFALHTIFRGKFGGKRGR